jgi:hypothetical protein
MAFNSLAKNRELIAAHGARLLPVMAQARPPEKAAESPIKNVPLPAEAARIQRAQSKPLHVDQRLAISSNPDVLLADTPTILIPNVTLREFAAADFPLLVVTDHSGIVRWIERAPDDALQSNGDIDNIVQQLLTTWPPA